MFPIECGLKKVDLLNEKRCVYFIGIGGISMSSLAALCIEAGISVQGSDVKRSALTEELSARGAVIYYEHLSANIRNAAPCVVVYSLAISADNPEISEAKHLGIPVISRAEMLSLLIGEYDFSLAVSASHGKSTTVAMLSRIFAEAEKKPTVLCGAPVFENLGVIFGSREYIILEACEYGRSFLKLRPDMLLLLNVELDHTDCYSNVQQLTEAFASAADNSRVAVMNVDDGALRAIAAGTRSRKITFAERCDADYKYVRRFCGGGKYGFDLYHHGRFVATFSLSVPGEFNLKNAVAAAVAADALGISVSDSVRALAEFCGIPRRLQKICHRCGTDIYYDYAHHPTEIGAVSTTLREMGYKRITAVFAPHTYSRTRDFFSEFSLVLSEFYFVFVCDIYGAREAAIDGVTASSLIECINASGGNAAFADVDSVTKFVKESGSDCLVLMGAGELSEIKKVIEEI